MYLELTGGRQSSLVLNPPSKKQNSSMGEIQIIEKELAHLSVLLTKEDEEAHDKMLQKIKEPLWQK